MFRYWYTRQWQEVLSKGHGTQITSLSARQPAWSFLARRLQQLAFRTGKHTVHISSAKKNEERPLSLSKQADTATRDNADDTGYYIFSAVCARWKDWSVVLAGQLFHDVPLRGKERRSSLRKYGLHFNGLRKTGLAHLTTREPTPGLHTVLSKCKWCWICCGQA